MVDYEDLIQRLEKAEGPRYELDAQIRELIAPRGSPYPPLPYTASLDAALRLVPEGWSGDVEFGPAGDAIVFEATMWNGKFAQETTEFAVVGNTPALALCIAALKARQVNEEAA